MHFRGIATHHKKGDSYSILTAVEIHLFYCFHCTQEQGTALTARFHSFGKDVHMSHSHGGAHHPLRTPSSPAATPAQFHGNDTLLVGIVLGVLTYWLFAGTLGNLVTVVVDSVGTANINEAVVSLAAPLAGLFAGLFVVVMGGVADRVGRVKIALIGTVLSIIGSGLLVLAIGPLATPFMLVGRAIQGVSTAMIMPATLALVKAYWDGKARQRAVSIWSMGSWGGGGFAALFGGFFSQNLNWRWIFIASIGFSIISFILIYGTPESKAENFERTRFDVVGLIIFMITTLATMVALIFGDSMPDGGWTSPITSSLFATGALSLTLFILWEKRHASPFIDFKLFKNRVFTGATLSNFLMNATIGLLNVSQLVLINARPRTLADCTNNACIADFVDRNGDGIHDQYLTAWDAGLLSITYAITIIVFIRVGEKLLQRCGPRAPMLWGTLIVMGAGAFLTPTFLMLDTYKILAIIAYGLFGVGLAFYATPSTDTALSSLPAASAGAGAGIYKMASSLGGAIGLALSLSLFNALRHGEGGFADVVAMSGVKDNINLRFAGMAVMVFNILLTFIALVSIMVTIPKPGATPESLGRRTRKATVPATTPVTGPAPGGAVS